MAVLFTIMANAKRHHLEPFAYVQDLLVKMSSLCAECGVSVPDFTEVSDFSAAEFRELGKSLANQLPTESLTALLPDHCVLSASVQSPKVLWETMRAG